MYVTDYRSCLKYLTSHHSRNPSKLKRMNSMFYFSPLLVTTCMYVYICLFVHRAVAERKRQVSTLIDSTPYLFEKGLVTTFLNQYQNNYGVIQLVYQFLILLALNYKHKW